MPKQSGNTFVALLRGINVGGKNMLSMSSLKTSFEKMRLQNVTTYINSGNVIFKCAEADPRKLEHKIEGMLAKEYDLNCKVVVRSLSEMEQLVKNLPRTWNADQDWRYNVIFLRHTIDSPDVIENLKHKKDIEQVVYRPGTLLWSAPLTKLNQTMMQKLSSQKIFQDMTVRNANTTNKIYELMKRA